MKSITNKGISICPQGEEKYVTFSITPKRRAMGMRVQYDYRHTDGELFSCIGHNLEHCREKRDRWLELKNASASNCRHYIPACYAVCATCAVGGYCNRVCDKFEVK